MYILAEETAGLKVLPNGGYDYAIIPAGAELFTVPETLDDGEAYVAVYAKHNDVTYAVSDVVPAKLEAELRYLTAKAQ